MKKPLKDFFNTTKNIYDYTNYINKVREHLKSNIQKILIKKNALCLFCEIHLRPKRGRSILSLI